MLDLIFIAFQIINVNDTTPCFLNFTESENMWENCGANQDFLQFMLLPWEWISGGYFSMILVSVLTAFTYIKYHKAIYPIMVGIALLPISFYLFPQQFINIAFILVGIMAGIFVIHMLTRQTKEY